MPALECHHPPPSIDRICRVSYLPLRTRVTFVFHDVASADARIRETISKIVRASTVSRLERSTEKFGDRLKTDLGQLTFSSGGSGGSSHLSAELFSSVHRSG